MRPRTKVTTYLLLSVVAASFVGFLVYWGVRSIESGIIAFGLTFIVTLVAIATMALMVPDNNNDPDKPVLR